MKENVKKGSFLDSRFLAVEIAATANSFEPHCNLVTNQIRHPLIIIHPP
jgi:hypothetical protein